MNSPVSHYNTLVELGQLQEDSRQRAVLSCLETLYFSLQGYNPYSVYQRLRRIFVSRPSIGQGYYIYGTVGAGKTVLLKMFYDSFDTDYKSYQHFQAFLLDVNRRLVAYNNVSGGDALKEVAKDLYEESWLFCFDECVVTDVGDAMLFGRVVEYILSRGGVVLATSNFSPDCLNPRGAGADIFKPYSEYFFSRVIAYDIDNTTDYRVSNGQGLWHNYFYPLTADTHQKIMDIVHTLQKGEGIPITVSVRGHDIYLDKVSNGVAYVRYENLLACPYGSEDFIALASTYKTLILDGMVKISSDDTSLAKRFILLIDAYYELGGTVILSAECSAEHLYESGSVAFEFQRCLSRLHSFNGL